MAAQTPTVHASAVLAGARAVLIRGPAGSGKSQLALALIQAAETGLLRFARLVGDDRVHLEARHGRLIVRPAAALAGLIEVRGLGIRRLDHCSRARWHKSNPRTLSSRSARRWKGAPLPQCNTVPKSPERPLRLGFGWS